MNIIAEFHPTERRVGKDTTSTHLVYCDFWVFSELNIIMKGKCVESIQDLKVAMKMQLKEFKKKNFQNCFRTWQEQWDKYFQSRED